MIPFRVQAYEERFGWETKKEPKIYSQTLILGQATLFDKIEAYKPRKNAKQLLFLNETNERNPRFSQLKAYNLRSNYTKPNANIVGPVRMAFLDIVSTYASGSGVGAGTIIASTITIGYRLLTMYVASILKENNMY